MGFIERQIKKSATKRRTSDRVIAWPAVEAPSYLPEAELRFLSALRLLREVKPIEGFTLVGGESGDQVNIVDKTRASVVSQLRVEAAPGGFAVEIGASQPSGPWTAGWRLQATPEGADLLRLETVSVRTLDGSMENKAEFKAVAAALDGLAQRPATIRAAPMPDDFSQLRTLDGPTSYPACFLQPLPAGAAFPVEFTLASAQPAALAGTIASGLAAAGHRVVPARGSTEECPAWETSIAPGVGPQHALTLSVVTRNERVVLDVKAPSWPGANFAERSLMWRTTSALLRTVVGSVAAVIPGAADEIAARLDGQERELNDTTSDDDWIEVTGSTPGIGEYPMSAAKDLPVGVAIVGELDHLRLLEAAQASLLPRWHSWYTRSLRKKKREASKQFYCSKPNIAQDGAPGSVSMRFERGTDGTWDQAGRRRLDQPSWTWGIRTATGSDGRTLVLPIGLSTRKGQLTLGQEYLSALRAISVAAQSIDPAAQVEALFLA